MEAVGWLSQSHQPSLANLEGMDMKDRSLELRSDFEWRLCNWWERCLQEFRNVMQKSCRRDYLLAQRDSRRYEAICP